MPGYMTHYIFGRKEYQGFEKGKVKSAIKKHREVYQLGLQGPDLFFYYPWKFLIGKRNLGSVMHHEKTGTYLQRMLEFILNIKGEDKKEIAIAYYAGFIGHYCLDVTCHPYIFYKSDWLNRDSFYKGKHIALETDIDFLLTKKELRCRNSDIHYGRLIQVSDRECAVTANMLVYACKGLYSGIKINQDLAVRAIKNMIRIINVTNDKKGRLKAIFQILSEVFLSLKRIEPILLNDEYRVVYEDPLNLCREAWYNPWISQDETGLMTEGEEQENQRYENFFELFAQASQMYQELMYLFQGTLSDDGEKELFLQKLGSKSFENGLELTD